MDPALTGARRFARWGLWFGGALVLFAAVLIGIDVLMRKFLDRSIGGADGVPCASTVSSAFSSRQDSRSG